MSQNSENKVISIPRKSIKKQNTIHVDEKHRLVVRTSEAILNSGGALAERIELVICILNDKLPEKRRLKRGFSLDIINIY
ncbi:MAG: hypothetical protein JKY17_05200 [Magnetovibrio sp.]|nr:hypothetical protein [Magnetovibrio sp.]